jgi:hypothetical protein
MPSELENTLQFSDEVIKFIAECDNDTYQRFCNLFEFLFGDCLLVKDLGDWERLATVSQENLFKFVVLKADNIIHMPDDRENPGHWLEDLGNQTHLQVLSADCDGNSTGRRVRPVWLSQEYNP